jgi:hypothetical protein
LYLEEEEDEEEEEENDRLVASTSWSSPHL